MTKTYTANLSVAFVTFEIHQTEGIETLHFLVHEDLFTDEYPMDRYIDDRVLLFLKENEEEIIEYYYGSDSEGVELAYSYTIKDYGFVSTIRIDLPMGATEGVMELRNLPFIIQPHKDIDMSDARKYGIWENPQD